MTKPLAAFLLVLAASCAGPRAPEATDSGVEGIVLAGPTCPVERADSPCPDQPAEAEIQVTDPDTQEVILVARSGADGRFRIPLPPGEYVLLALPARPAGPPVSSKPEPVTVRAGRFTEITLRIDTGIR